MPESDLKPDQSKAVAPKSPQSPLLKADKATLAIAAQRDGSLRVTYAGWDDARVILRGSRSNWSGPRGRCGDSAGGVHRWPPPHLRDLQSLGDLARHSTFVVGLEFGRRSCASPP
jgi:hypothetical protein